MSRVSSGFVASTVGLVGPTLLRFGSAEQQVRYLKPLLVPEAAGALPDYAIAR
jgi:hypothetical protein